jgi:purine nucleoside permease
MQFRARVRRVVPLLLLTLLLGTWTRTLALEHTTALTSPTACLSDCTPRIGIISAFGAEADLLLSAMQQTRTWWINGNRFTTGVLRGEPVVVVLCGVSMVNAAMVTQQLLDRFRIERLLLSGIAGGIDPEGQVGDVTIPARWALPLEAWWGPDGALPAPCGKPGDLACLGLQLLSRDGVAVQDYRVPVHEPPDHAPVASGLRMRDTFVRRAGSGIGGEFRSDFPVDTAMLEVAATLQPGLERCGPLAPQLCVSVTPRLRVGGTGVSVPLFLANPDYRNYLAETLQARVLDMETAAVAQVAYASQIPFLALRSVSDLAGGGPNGDVGALFRSGLAEANSARVTLAFLDAWSAHRRASGQPATPAAPSARALKVLIITMFQPEAEPWLAPLGLDQRIPVVGLPSEYPVLRCNRDDVCLMTTGMGHANAAASTMAVALDPQFDLSRTWFLVAGIAGIDPSVGTVGSAAWAHFLVDFGLAQELDAREMPKAWPSGYLGILTAGPDQKPRMEYHSEVFELDSTLLAKAMDLSRGIVLEDSDRARAYRAHYRQAAARSAPAVLQCDTLAGDTWWHGRHLGERASRWTKLLTDGRGHYCTTQQEDNATATALYRAGAAGRLDPHRLAVLRTAANFDRPYLGQSAYESLRADSGGFGPAASNLFRVGSPLVREIVGHWSEWAEGVPRP